MTTDDLIKSLVEAKIKQPVTQEMIDDGYDLSVDLAIDVFDTVVKTSNHGFNHDPVEAIRCSQVYWEKVCDYIESIDSTKSCQKFALLLVISHMIDTIRDRAGDEVADKIQSAVQIITEERKDKLFKDPVQTYPTMTDEEVDDVVKNCDPNLLKEFFECFRKVGTFYADPNKYDSDEQKETQHKMLAIYNKMLK
jgi:hypothetical protein